MANIPVVVPQQKLNVPCSVKRMVWPDVSPSPDNEMGLGMLTGESLIASKNVAVGSMEIVVGRGDACVAFMMPRVAIAATKKLFMISSPKES